MKLKQHLYITDAQRFMRGDYNWCFALNQNDDMGGRDWHYCGEIEIDVTVDTGDLIASAKSDIDDKIGKHTAAINVLENRKSELLALTYQVDVEESDYESESLDDIAAAENYAIDSQGL